MVMSPRAEIRTFVCGMLCVVSMAWAQDRVAAAADLQYPIIARYGGVVARPTATAQPRANAKVVLDATSDSKPDEVNKGLERAARLLNLYGTAGLKETDVQIVIVLHGEATKSVLSDEAYKARAGVERNPNLPLIRALRKAGVEVVVCGQALHYKKIEDSDVADDIQIAAAALTVVVNKQTDGFAYIPIP